MATRGAIPRPVQRHVRIEAGHRCAIPTCRGTSGLEIHHIREYAKGGGHTVENLILLCAVCHARITAGEIDRESVKAYKANLALLNSRYGDLERRVISKFVGDPQCETVAVDVSHRILLEYLIEDGLLEYRGPADGAVHFQIAGGPTPEELPLDPGSHFGTGDWGLTESGLQFVAQLRRAERVN